MKRRVLVVDDDKLVADTLSLVFRANGFESEATYSADDGIARARAFNPALMLLDVTMPRRSGIDLLEQIHLEIPDCKVLMLTAYSSNFAKVGEHGRRTGRTVSVLSKPCRAEDLLREADALLSHGT